jgi:hypothetical protein
MKLIAIPILHVHGHRKTKFVMMCKNVRNMGMKLIAIPILHVHGHRKTIFVKI